MEFRAMSALAGLTQTREPMSGTDFRLLLHEALTALENASISLEMLAMHGITHSSNFDQLATFVGRALEAASVLEERMQAPAKTIFPTAAMAQAFCTMHPLDGGRSYQIHVDGAGRATVSIHLLAEYL
jgi:hypothetical protein